MDSVSLGIVEFRFDVDYPEIQCEMDLRVPHGIPEEGGRTIRLRTFSLSLSKPTVSVPVDTGPFGGSITATLDTSRCEIEVSGHVKLDLFLKKFHWKVGPARVRYFTPLVLIEPAWSVNPAPVDGSRLQAQIDATPPQNTHTGKGTSIHNDAATQDAIRALLFFCGAGTLVDDMLEAARTLASNGGARPATAGAPATDVARDVAVKVAVAAPPAAPAPGAAAVAATHGSSSAVVLGMGLGGVGAAFGGGGGSLGFFFTSDGDFGYFGSVSLGLGLIAELSAGATGLIYWPDAGEAAIDCFQGYNWFLAVDVDAGVGLSGALSWPCDSSDVLSSTTPCGLALGLGAGVGFPINFMVGSSRTWIDLNPPADKPGPPHGH